MRDASETKRVSRISRVSRVSRVRSSERRTSSREKERHREATFFFVCDDAAAPRTTRNALARTPSDSPEKYREDSSRRRIGNRGRRRVWREIRSREFRGRRASDSASTRILESRTLDDSQNAASHRLSWGSSYQNLVVVENRAPKKKSPDARLTAHTPCPTFAPKPTPSPRARF